MRPIEQGEFSILNNTEDAPQIVGVIDERGPVDFADKRRWRIIADDGEGNVACDSNENYGSMDGASRVETWKNSSENGKSSKFRDSSPSRNASLDSDLSPLWGNEKKMTNMKHSGKRDGSTKRKKRRESSSDSSQSNSSDFNDRRKSKSKKMSSKDKHDASPIRRSKRESSESDQSPPRKRENERTIDNKEYSGKERRRGNSDSDQSPPRKRKNRDKGEHRGRRKNRGNSDSDQSPPRRRKNHGEEEYRGKTKNRKNSDSDQSPPRKRKNHDEEEYRRKEKNLRNSDSDQSPPRRRKNHDEEESKRKEKNRRNSDSDQSPPRRRKNHDEKEYRRKEKNRRNSDSDQSPPRRRKNHDQDADKEEYSRKKETRRTFVSDSSPPRRSKTEISSKNHSKKSKDSDSDLSPPRAPKNTRIEESRSNRDERTDTRNDARNRRLDERPSRKSRSRWNDDDDDSRAPRGMEPQRKNSGVGGEAKMKKTLDGKTAGLQDARALRIETEAHKKREAAVFKGMSAEVSGVGQAAVFRDRKTGRRRDFAAEAAETREKEKRQAEIDEKYAKWGRGLKQVDDQAEKRERDMYEMSKPLARYANDADLDKALREVEREGDPMAEEIRKRRIKEGKSEPAPAVYQGSYAPNRFGIRPGYRWDGVDRSNGYEKKWFEARNARTALREEAYKWSTADM
ncbi:BUD13 homolog isoform X2 [Venturia canescens]|nr:BUD13 homolog isoform X2 [Venturia canescens]